MTGPARMRRIDEAVREVLGTAVSKLQDPRIGFVTVTSVRTSSDLRHAKVYFSVLGTEDEREKTLWGLQHAHGYLQRLVAAELRIKHTPTLNFEYDDSIDRGMRISELIDEVAPKDEDTQ